MSIGKMHFTNPRSGDEFFKTTSGKGSGKNDDVINGPYGLPWGRRVDLPIHEMVDFYGNPGGPSRPLKK